MIWSEWQRVIWKIFHLNNWAFRHGWSFLELERN